MAFDGLKTIGQIHVSVTDVDRSVAFYRDVLGLPFLFRVPGQPMAFFDCDGVRLYLGVPESEAYRARGMLYFAVRDIGEVHRALVGRGVAFLDAPHVVHRGEEGELHMAFFTDPDGNNLALMEDVPLPHTEG
jgi:catechol 2,3-dioxygenase-like lactoylglutathione lyase family enzyme